MFIPAVLVVIVGFLTCNERYLAVGLLCLAVGLQGFAEVAIRVTKLILPQGRPESIPIMGVKNSKRGGVRWFDKEVSQKKYWWYRTVRARGVKPLYQGFRASPPGSFWSLHGFWCSLVNAGGQKPHFYILHFCWVVRGCDPSPWQHPPLLVMPMGC